MKDSIPLFRRYRWQIFAVTWLAYAGLYLTRKSFAVAKVELAKPEIMGLTKGDLAWIDGAYLTAYAIGQFLWGMCGDRFGTRKVILVGLLMSVITAISMGCSSTILLLGFFFAVQGLCQSTGWGPLSKNVGYFFSRQERGRVMGFWCTNYALGGVMASALAGWAAQSFGWRYAFWVPAGVLFVIWILFYFYQANRPEDVGLPPVDEFHKEQSKPSVDTVDSASSTPHEDGSWQAIKQVITNPMVLVLACVYFLLKPTRYLILFWSPTYLNERLGTGAAESGILGSMFDFAGPISVLAGGFISDLYFGARRVPICVIALIIVSITLFLFSYLPNTRLALGVGFFVIGFFLYIPDSLVSGTAPIDFGRRSGASTAAGLINGFGSIGAIVGGTMPGWIERFLGEGQDIWQPIFTGLGVSLLLAAAVLMPRWNAVPKHHQSSEGAD